MKFQTENEEDLKDKLDFPSADADGDSRSDLFLLPALQQRLSSLRPPVGCRTLVARNVYRILPAAINDLSDSEWLVANREKAAQLLVLLIWNAEESTTQYVDKVIVGLAKAAADESSLVVSHAREAGRVSARFVEPTVWLPLVLSAIRGQQGGQQQMGYLFALSAFVGGTRPPARLAAHLPNILAVLTTEDVAHTLLAAQQVQLLACIREIVALGPIAAPHTYQVFSFIFLSLDSSIHFSHLSGNPFPI